MANILYRKEKQQKSLDNGITWIDTGEYRVGKILENPSNCSSPTSTQYRWVELELTEGYYCDGFDKYTVEVEESSTNGIVWDRTGNQRKGATMIELDSLDCGSVIEYRWVIDENDESYSCNEDTFTKYAYEYEESSINGKAWTRTGNKRQSSTVLETDSKDCGYCATVQVVGYMGYYKYPYVRINETLYGLNEKKGYNDRFYYKIDNIVTYISFSTSYYSDNYRLSEITYIPDTSNISNMSFMFNGCRGLTSIDAIYSECFNTSNATNMNNMFNGCSGLTSLDLRHFNTTNVTDMRSMFLGCSGLTDLDLSGWNTSNVTNINDIFYNCKNLSNVNLSGWDMSKVGDLSHLFSSCSRLETVNLNNFKTTNVTNMSSMFSPSNTNYISSIEKLDLSSFDTSSVTNMNIMFQSCEKLKTLNLSNWDTSNVTGYTSMFLGCSGLTTITMDNCSCETIEFIKKALNESYVKQEITFITNTDCGEIEDEVVREWITLENDFYCDGYDKYTLEVERISINGGEWDYTGNERKGTLLETNSSDCSYTTTCSNELAFEFTGSSLKYRINSKTYSAKTSPYTVTLDELGVTEFTKANIMFSGGTNLTKVTSIPCTDNVTNMYSMFSDCSKLTTLDLSSFDTSSVTNMGSMFFNCSGLTSLDLSSFNTSNITDMSYIFYNCRSLTSLDLSSFNTSNVTNMDYLFYNCYNLTSLDLSGWDMSSVTNMNYMFYQCSKLTSIKCIGCNEDTINKLNSVKPSNCTLVQ